MAPDDLKALLVSETDRIEWKQTTRDADGILRAVCGLANDLGASGQPGWLLLGVDKTDQIVGIEATARDVDAELRVLSERLRSPKLLPTPAFDARAMTIDGRIVLVVKVDPYAVPPVVEVDGRAWVRQGTTTVLARQADVLRLSERRPSNRQPFDLWLCEGATIDDLDTHQLREQYGAAQLADPARDVFPTFEEWLSARQLGRTTARGWTPNTTAILMYGQSPQTWFPGAAVEFVRYGGVDLDSPVVIRRSVAGTLPVQLDALWAQLTAHLASIPIASEGIKDGFAPEYPLDALKELARNLVQHRMYQGTHAPGRVEWYDDRIEFSNPGGLFGHASEGDFGSHSDYRNPTMTSHLVQAGYVQQLGRGVRLVRRVLERNGNPPLECEVDGFTRVIVRRHP